MTREYFVERLTKLRDKMQEGIDYTDRDGYTYNRFEVQVWIDQVNELLEFVRKDWKGVMQVCNDIWKKVR